MEAANDGVDVPARLRAFIADELNASLPDGLNDETPLLMGLIDSGGLMRIVVFLEEAFGVDIEDDDLVAEHFSTVSGIDRLIASKLDALRSS